MSVEIISSLFVYLLFVCYGEIPIGYSRLEFYLGSIGCMSVIVGA